MCRPSLLKEFLNMLQQAKESDNPLLVSSILAIAA